MIVCRGVLIRLALKRLPMIKFYDMMFFVNAFIDLMIKRMVEDRLIDIDGFGIFSRTKSKPHRVFNVYTKQFQEIVSNSVAFRPHHDFLQLIESTGKDYLIEIIKKKSAEEISKRKRRKRLI